MDILKKDWVYQGEDSYYDNAYHWKFWCDNCGKENYIWVKHGARVPEFVECEHCKCLSGTN